MVSVSAALNLDNRFDFAKAQDGNVARLKAAVDDNGATAADLIEIRRSHHLHKVVARTSVRVRWEAASRHHSGRAGRGTTLVGFVHLDATVEERFGAYASKTAHVETIVAKLSSGATGFTGLGSRIALGDVPEVIGAERHCGCCSGHGEVRCTRCLHGRIDCNVCYGKGYTTYVADGRTNAMRCAAICMSGKVYCPDCRGATKITCEGCEGTGVITTVWEGSVFGDVEYGFETPDGQSEDWSKLLAARGRTWLANAGFRSVPDIERRTVGADATWRVDVPVMALDFAVLGSKQTAFFVGREPTIWKVPAFLDALLAPVASRIDAAAAKDAFAIAATYALPARIASEVLRTGGEDEAVRASFAQAVSPDFVRAMRRSLTRARDTIASSAVAAIWRCASVAVGVGAALLLAVGAFESLAAAVGPRIEPAARWSAGVCVGVLFVALALTAVYATAGKGGRSALSATLGRRVTARPSQGFSPVLGSLVAVAIYGLAAVCFAPPVKPTAKPAGASASPLRPAR